MASNQKRSRYISESTTDDDAVDMDYTPNGQPKKPGRKPTRTPKCFSKNALMARENRLKKKVYVTNLENQASYMKNENKKLSAIVENQSFMIDELKKEVKYLKSVISNSQDIGRLIRAINLSTGMSVTSSLDRQHNINTAVSNKSSITAQAVPDCSRWGQNLHDSKMKHPWEEKLSIYTNYPTPESTNSHYSNTEFEELNNEDLLLDLDLPFEMNNDELLGMINEKVLESTVVPKDEHNYHSPIKFEGETSNNDDDVGVCLHVSKNKVSLEFCPSCSDNALKSSLRPI